MKPHWRIRVAEWVCRRIGHQVEISQWDVCCSRCTLLLWGNPATWHGNKKWGAER